MDISTIEEFWAQQLEEISNTDYKDFKQQDLPLARIKKIIKSDEDIKKVLVSSEVPVLFAKACELFILDLAVRSFLHTDASKRKTLQRSDISAAISKCEMFDFLIDIIPHQEPPASKFPYGTFENQLGNMGNLGMPMGMGNLGMLPNDNSMMFQQQLQYDTAPDSNKRKYPDIPEEQEQSDESEEVEEEDEEDDD